MSRQPLRYGNKLLLFCDARRGYVVGTNSALAPLGVRQDTKEDPLAYERAVFMIAPGDGDYATGDAAALGAEEVKFGQVVRLIHMMHQKPMAQNVNLHAMVNKANQRVTLEKTTTSGDTSDKWRVMPRYRLRGEGERVCCFDHVVLQGVSGEIAYLHVSSTKDAAVDGCYEVNCGAVAEGFELRVYDGDDERDVRDLRGGQCVVLFHKEEGRLLSVEPKSGTCMLDPVEGDQQDGGEAGTVRAQPTQAHSYKSLFILEFADPRHGGLVEGGRRNTYRLKALCNGRYLRVGERSAAAQDEEAVLAAAARAQQTAHARALAESDVLLEVDRPQSAAARPLRRYEVALSGNMEDPGTLFVFHQAGDDQRSTLQSGSRVFIEAPLVGGEGVWIVSGGAVEPRHLRELLGAPTTEQKPLYLDCCEEKSMRDGMQVHRLPNDEYEELSIVLSLLPPLQTYVDAMTHEELEGNLVTQVLENARHLRRMCFAGATSATLLAAGSEVDGLLNTVGQLRLLRQGVPQLCIEILRCTLESALIDHALLNTMEVVRPAGETPAFAASPGGPSFQRRSTVAGDGSTPVKYADILELLNSCFSLVLAVVRGQPSHARELGQYLQFLVSCCRVLPSALECVAEFYRDNLELVSTPGDTKSLHFFLDMLVERGRDTAVLEVVTLFARCGEEGLAESQQLIVERLLRHKETAKGLVLPVTSSGGVLHVGVPASYGGLPHERGLPVSDDTADAITLIPIVRLKDVVGRAYIQQGRNAVLPYLTQQVLLLAAVCAGRNAASTLAVQQLIPPELMLPLLECEGMAPELHAAFVRLFTRSLVDVAGSPDLFERTRSIRHVVDEPHLTESYTLEEEVPGILASAKRYALRYVSKRGRAARDDDSRVLELDAVTLLMSSLMKRGVFGLDEYVDVASAMTSVLHCGAHELPTTSDASAVHAMRNIIAVLNRLADFLLTRDVFDVVTSFVRGMPLRHISQFQDLSPSSRISSHSKRRMELLKADAVNAKLNSLFSLGEAAEGFVELDALVVLLHVLMTIARTESWGLRSDAIRLFCRLTNYPGELLLTVRRVQLLTSAASAEFYGRVKRVASELEAFSKTPLAESSLANGEAALQHIETLLTQRDCGAMIEKIAMLRHAEVPQMLIALLRGIPTPPKDDVRLFVYNVVGLLQTMAQDPLVLELLAESVGAFVHLTQHDMDVLSLLRTIYCGKAAMAMLLPARAVKEVVACVSLGHSAAHAISLLREIIATKDAGGKYIAKNQRAVWKALVADGGTSRLLRLRGTWTGRRGTAQRDQLLMSEEYFNHSGRLRLHVALMEVLFLVAKTNELVKAEEIRDELFGANAVDELVEIVTNQRLPAFYRFRFVNILQVTVVQDSACVSSLFTHRAFPEFIGLCRADVNRCVQLLGGKCALVADGEAIAAIDRGVLRMPPSNAFEEAIELRRTSLDFYLELTVLGIVPCVKHLMAKFVKGTGRLNQAIRQRLVDSINELVDCVCDLLREVFVLGSFHELAFFQPRLHRKKARDFLAMAVKCSFCGSGRWSDDIEALEEAIPVEDADVLSESERAAGAGGGADEKALTSKWLEFVRKHLQEGAALKPKNLYASGAGLILRSGARGTHFVRTLVLSLRDLPVTEQARVLHLLRQVVSLREGAPFDDSVMLRIPPSEDETAPLPGGALSLSKQMADRQQMLGSYFGDRPHMQVMPAVAQLMAGGVGEARPAALRCALVMLHGGHRRMQESLYDSMSRRSDEDLFVVMRNHLQQCRDALRSYRYALRRGAQEEALVVLGPLQMVVLELRFLQLLCEGHFEALQHYLRAQPDNHVSVNVLESMVELLEVTVGAVDANTYELLMQLLSTITETIQGPCRSNQDFFVTVNAAEFLTQLMILPLEHPSLEEEKVRELRAASLSVLLALIEGRMEVPFLSGLISKLDLGLMGSAMEQSAKEYEARWGALEEKTSVFARSFGFLRRILSYLEKIYKRDDRDETQDELCVAVNIFIFFKACLDLEQLRSYSGSTYEFVDRKGTTIREVLRRTYCYKAVNKRVGMVEMLREGALERSYFRILSVSSDNLRDYSKDEVIKNVDRSSDNKRLQSFFEQCHKLMMELDSYAEMQHSPILSFIHDYAAEFDILGLLVVFVINLIMLVTYRAPDNIYDDPVPAGITEAVRVLGIILIVFQCMLFVNFFFGPTRVYLEGCWLRWQDAKVDELIDENRAGLSIEAIDEDVNFLDNVTPVQYYLQSAYYILQFGKFYQLSLYLLCAIMGYVQSPIWYSIQLLQITSKSTMLYNVVLAIANHGLSLGLTFLLVVFVCYIFASVVYYHFSELFNPHALEVPGFECDSMWMCLLNVVDSLRADGAIGERAVPPWYHTEEGLGYPFFFLSLAFFAAVKLVALQLVFGIIVDSFAQLREDREFVEEDQVNKCFICGVEQNEFDRVVPGGFEHHIRTEHNMWQYLFFLHYITKKDKSNLSGQESHVWKRMKAKESSFFPIGRAMMLQADVVDPGADAERQLEAYRGVMASVVTKFTEGVESRLEAFAERLEDMEKSMNRPEPLSARGEGIDRSFLGRRFS